MKRRSRCIAILTGLIAATAWWYARTPEPTILAFRLGQTFEQVVNNSTYPALERSNRPADDPEGNKFGAIWVREPSVIIRFTDPNHGFTLPPTKFAALTFSENQAVSLATSPMLDPLPFEEAVAILENLQNQFKAGGWEPWERNDSTWFDLSPEGKKRLHARMFKSGYMESTTLRIPQLYGMIFRLKCSEGCWTREPPYRRPGRKQVRRDLGHRTVRHHPFHRSETRIHAPAHQIRRPQLLGKPGAPPCHLADARPAAFRRGRDHPGKFAEPVQGRRLGALGAKRQYLVRPDPGR